jgi:hypothetical protein
MHAKPSATHGISNERSAVCVRERSLTACILSPRAKHLGTSRSNVTTALTAARRGLLLKCGRHAAEVSRYTQVSSLRPAFEMWARYAEEASGPAVEKEGCVSSESRRCTQTIPRGPLSLRTTRTPLRKSWALELWRSRTNEL